MNTRTTRRPGSNPGSKPPLSPTSTTSQPASTLPQSPTSGLPKPTDGHLKNRNFQPPNELLNAAYFQNSFRTLSIDGGGARGMIPAVILKEIERRSGKPICDLFDRICGTSTGSILACGLAAPKAVGSREPRHRARDIVELYRTLGASIFSRGSFNETVLSPMNELLGRSNSWIATHPGETISTIKEIWNRVNSPLHDINKLAFKLHEQFADLKMEDAITELFVYAYDIGSRTPEILGSSESTIPGARNYSKFRMYQAATASSAAVPFFAPYNVWRNPTPPMELPSAFGNTYPDVSGTGDNYNLVDGGNGGLGNPSMFALLEETPKSSGRNHVLVSLGTGHSTSPVPSASKNWGFVQWLGEGGELLKCAFDGEADVTDESLRKMLTKDETYFRWQPSIPAEFAFLDEGSREDMDALEDLAQAFIAEHDEDIDALIGVLTASPTLVRR
jgi:uncharacterized protein